MAAADPFTTGGGGGGGGGLPSVRADPFGAPLQLRDAVGAMDGGALFDDMCDTSAAVGAADVVVRAFLFMHARASAEGWQLSGDSIFLGSTQYVGELSAKVAELVPSKLLNATSRALIYAMLSLNLPTLPLQAHLVQFDNVVLNLETLAVAEGVEGVPRTVLPADLDVAALAGEWHAVSTPGFDALCGALGLAPHALAALLGATLMRSKELDLTPLVRGNAVALAAVLSLVEALFAAHRIAFLEGSNTLACAPDGIDVLIWSVQRLDAIRRAAAEAEAASTSKRRGGLGPQVEGVLSMMMRGDTLGVRTAKQSYVEVEWDVPLVMLAPPGFTFTSRTARESVYVLDCCSSACEVDTVPAVPDDELGALFAKCVTAFQAARAAEEEVGAWLARLEA